MPWNHNRGPMTFPPPSPPCLCLCLPTCCCQNSLLPSCWPTATALSLTLSTTANFLRQLAMNQRRLKCYEKVIFFVFLFLFLYVGDSGGFDVDDLFKFYCHITNCQIFVILKFVNFSTDQSYQKIKKMTKSVFFLALRRIYVW